MPQNKTIYTEQDPYEFLDSIDDDIKKKDSYRLIEILRECSNEPPKMFGPSIIGFGTYHYKYASGHEGFAPLIGFSPRKAAISLYISTGEEHDATLLKELGKYKMGKACIYVKKLSDVNEAVIKKLATRTIDYLSKTYNRI